MDSCWCQWISSTRSLFTATRSISYTQLRIIGLAGNGKLFCIHFDVFFFVTFVTFVNPPTSKTKDICLDGRNIVICSVGVTASAPIWGTVVDSQRPEFRLSAFFMTTLSNGSTTSTFKFLSILALGTSCLMFSGFLLFCLRYYLYTDLNNKSTALPIHLKSMNIVTPIPSFNFISYLLGRTLDAHSGRAFAASFSIFFVRWTYHDWIDKIWHSTHRHSCVRVPSNCNLKLGRKFDKDVCAG